MTFVGQKKKKIATGSHYVKQNKPVSKRQIPCVFFLMQKLDLKGCVCACITKLEKGSRKEKMLREVGSVDGVLGSTKAEAKTR